ncbi:MAG: hypothetical protein ACXVC6_14690 [Bacteroidia bacterium]
MKSILKKASLVILMAVGFSVAAQPIAKAKANKDTEKFRYEIECVSVGASGSYLVKVWSYSKKANVAIEQAKKNAVHGVIFKGFTGAGAGCTQKALASNPSIEEEKAEFFDNFFMDGGKYQKFVSVSGDGSVAAEDRMKVGKEYKIGVVVSVLKDALRADLEAAGIIKGLSSGF